MKSDNANIGLTKWRHFVIPTLSIIRHFERVFRLKMSDWCVLFVFVNFLSFEKYIFYRFQRDFKLWTIRILQYFSILRQILWINHLKWVSYDYLNRVFCFSLGLCIGRLRVVLEMSTLTVRKSFGMNFYLLRPLVWSFILFEVSTLFLIPLSLFILFYFLFTNLAPIWCG